MSPSDSGPHTNLPSDLSLGCAPLTELSGPTWHAISRLRQDVFIVEQDCAYPDQDARDAEPGTLHLWIAAGPGAQRPGEIMATLRILVEPNGARRIGRVATAADHRGKRLMGTLLRDAITRCEGLAIDIDAQAHLQGWYENFGFVRVGDEFLEDGIPHVPMRRTPADAGSLVSRE
jgi:ElaA protein